MCASSICFMTPIIRSPVLQTIGITKSFSHGSNRIQILKGIDFSVYPDESVAILGKSGSGKSTLLQICGLLDSPSSGNIFIDGNAYQFSNDKLVTEVRRQKLGFVYQFHHLLPEFSVLENLVIPQRLNGVSMKEARQRAMHYLEIVDMHTKDNAQVSELSGGEQQRVAIIRGIINQPDVIFADEPTGNLDAINAELVSDLFAKILSNNNTAVVIVTHNIDLARKCTRIVKLEDGMLFE